MSNEKQFGNIDYLLSETKAKHQELTEENNIKAKELAEKEAQIRNAQGVLALTNFWSRTLKNYKGNETFAKVIQGFDLDGDGKVDSIEVLE